MQIVRGIQRAATGVSYLPTVSIRAMSGVSAALMPRIGARSLLVAGSAVAAALSGYPRSAMHSTYAGGLLGPMLVTATGLGVRSMRLTLVALLNFEERDAGLVSSLVNTASWSTGPSGLAVLGTVAWTVVAYTAR